MCLLLYYYVCKTWPYQPSLFHPLKSRFTLEQAKIADFRGYTDQPLYSTWFGSEDEERAVFVDEIKCVGCLICALFAEKTFVVESIYGRARAVAQWADPEQKTHDAIQACPVDCISMVERSVLAVLNSPAEMSKLEQCEDLSVGGEEEQGLVFNAHEDLNNVED
ncbi:hypothetical protein Sjap_026093 [Stephania japonica]|uniref:4Fe-4S ferredoxin-type domain-containing protein n=1 Tax=Stephania japonica TaxID=461633 RepID=A0AAP0E7C3_9MAGN